jgi:DNA-binding CsgD family transcriptional regulator
MDGYNLAPEQVKIGAASHAQTKWAEGIVECYRSKVCGTMDEHMPDPEVRAAVRALYAPVGIRDQVLINGANHSGIGCALYVFSAKLLRLTSSERTVLTRIASHLSTAYRLQRRLAQPLGRTANRDFSAIMTVRGRVEHAEPAASSRRSRLCLKDAVESREWARTATGRVDAESATGAWRPLITGRWSLVDCYERNGLRYIVACENEPATPRLDTLSARELQVSSLAELGRSNKAIAYELDLAHSTVRVLLARAACKLGVRTRTELIAQLRALRSTAEDNTQTASLPPQG